MNAKVDELLSRMNKWSEEMVQLRKIMLNCQLTEAFKWGAPCYEFQHNNIVILHAFKDYCAIGFFKGALLKDVAGILVKPGEHTQLGRQMRFTHLQAIKDHTATIQAYIKEAIAVEQTGIKPKIPAIAEIIFPIELEQVFNDNLILKTAFEKLTPGRQRAYMLYFSAPKQSATKISRIEKYTQQIINGKGINDCTCGLSKKMPACDGSHKYLSSKNTAI